MVHKTALVSDKAKLGANVKVGAFAIIDDDCVIGDNTEIAPRAHIMNGARIGSGNYIGEGTIIADKPQDLKFTGETSYVEIGDNNVIREYVTIHRSTTPGKATKIGSNNFLMVMVHVAHDCVIGSNIIIVNNAGISGHVHIDDFAFVSGMTPIHQNVRIGSYAMIGGGMRIVQDIAPFAMVGGDTTGIHGINKLGLKRRGFAKERIEKIEDFFHIYFREKLLSAEALKKIEEKYPSDPDASYFTGFIRGSKRGMTR